MYFQYIIELPCGYTVEHRKLRDSGNRRTCSESRIFRCSTVNIQNLFKNMTSQSKSLVDHEVFDIK